MRKIVGKSKKGRFALIEVPNTDPQTLDEVTEAMINALFGDQEAPEGQAKPQKKQIAQQKRAHRGTPKS